jgi:glycosyltransferase involved in cell wall biosynthesis
MSAPRVLLVSQPTITGVAQCVLDWSTGLAERGWDVHLACPEDGWLSQACSQAGITTHDWSATRSPGPSVVGESRSLSRLVDQVRPDVVHLHASKAGLVGRLVLRGSRPTAFSPHSWSFDAATGPVGAAALRWERAAARWTDAFICVGEAEAADGAAAGIGGFFSVARNGVDTERIRPLGHADRQRMRQSLGIPVDARALVCVGRLQRQKGQDVLLEAWRRADLVDAHLYLVGDGPDREALESLGTRRVTFVGSVAREHALDWMAAADLVVMPSRWEGMALVPLESMALGTPVIASDVAGAREAIDDTTGRVVAPEDPAALAAALQQWFVQDQSALDAARAAGRARIEEGFRLAATIDQVDAVLRGLLPGHRGTRPDQGSWQP